MIWLDKDELQFLTGYKRKRDQVKALAELGIPFRQRPADGFPLVQRAHVEPQRGRAGREPNFAAAGG